MTSRHLFGVISILMVVILWASAAFLTEHIFQRFDKPFITTYFNTTMFSLFLFGHLVRPSQQRDENVDINTEPVTEVSNSNTRDQIGFVDTAKLALQFCWLWAIANYFNNLSYSLTLVSSTTILASTSSLWTLIIGSFLKIERFSSSRILAIILSIAGVTFVSCSQSERKDLNAGEKHNDFLGNFLSLASAFTYACYTSLLKYKIKDEKNVSVMLFFGLVGIFNFLLLWPLILVFDFFGLEKFSLPSGNVWLMLILNGVVGTALSEFLWLRATLLTSPLVATMGLSLMTPIVLTIDVILGMEVKLVYVFGGVLVLLGFVIVNLSGIYSEADRRFDENLWKEIRDCFCRRQDYTRIENDEL